MPGGMHYGVVNACVHECTNSSNNQQLAKQRAGLRGCASAGKTEKKEHLLAETDDMWVALRHKHFADATNEITRTMDEFRQKNKAAAYKQGAGGDGALDLRNMKNLVSSLPQYR